MADFYTNHLAAVSEQLCLGTVAAMQQAAALRQGNITHAVIVCSHAELRHVDSAKELSVADVLPWLLADPQLAQALKSCSAVGVQAKLIPVNVPEQVSFLCIASTYTCGLVACFVAYAQANENHNCATCWCHCCKEVRPASHPCHTGIVRIEVLCSLMRGSTRIRHW